VARYFLHVRYKTGPNGLAVDEEGDEVANEEALRAYVADTARDLMLKSRITGIDWRTCIFEVTDEADQLVLTMPFAEAVQ
jgi:hypothetical protein